LSSVIDDISSLLNKKEVGGGSWGGYVLWDFLFGRLLTKAEKAVKKSTIFYYGRPGGQYYG
jgi:hypothetical protein